MPGCQLYHSLDPIQPLSLTLGRGSVSLSLPANPSLRGVEFFVQAAADSLTTNAGRITFGLR